MGDKDMKDRRELLTAGAAAMSAAVSAIPALALGLGEDCERPARGPNAADIPNHVVITHQGAKAWFYDDLVAGRTVVLHCMSIATEPKYRTVESLARVQPLLAGRLGRDVFFYSLTVDPERDTVNALRDFAARQGAGPGWSFLTGEPAALLDLKARLFSHSGGHAHGVDGEAEDCALAMLRYGNAAVGLWGSVPAGTSPEWIVRRLSWVETREPVTGPPRRGGPSPDTYLRSEGRMS
jgi:protein SCO1/2